MAAQLSRHGQSHGIFPRSDIESGTLPDGDTGQDALYAVSYDDLSKASPWPETRTTMPLPRKLPIRNRMHRAGTPTPRGQDARARHTNTSTTGTITAGTIPMRTITMGTITMVMVIVRMGMGITGTFMHRPAMGAPS